MAFFRFVIKYNSFNMSCQTMTFSSDQEMKKHSKEFHTSTVVLPKHLGFPLFNQDIQTRS
jgi:hypothetical protein